MSDYIQIHSFFLVIQNKMIKQKTEIRSRMFY